MKQIPVLSELITKNDKDHFDELHSILDIMDKVRDEVGDAVETNFNDIVEIGERLDVLALNLEALKEAETETETVSLAETEEHKEFERRLSILEAHKQALTTSLQQMPTPKAKEASLQRMKELRAARAARSPL